MTSDLVVRTITHAWIRDFHRRHRFDPDGAQFKRCTIDHRNAGRMFHKLSFRHLRSIYDALSVGPEFLAEEGLPRRKGLRTSGFYILT